MEGVSWVVVLSFLAVAYLVFQVIMERRHRRAARRRAQQQAEQAAQQAQGPSAPHEQYSRPRLEYEDVPTLEQAAVLASNEWGSALERFAPRAPAPVPALRVRPPRRYSRQALFGSQRKVQDAVVIAAIMGPCRALEAASDPVAPQSARRRTG